MIHWWEKEPLRIVEICNAFDFDSLTIEQEVKTVKRLRGNAQHFHCMGCHGGLDDTKFFFKTSVSKKVNPDRLQRYLPLAHRNGIKVIVYFNVHWYSREFGRQHPDWQQIKEDGAPIDEVYTTGTSFCVNSPYREWVFQVLRDLCQYDIDGIFYDGPIFFASTCYCQACQRLFKEKTQERLPSKSNRNNPLWKKLLEFQSESIAKFLFDSNRIIKEADSEILFYMNGNSNWPYWPTGRDNHKIIKNTDILGAEGGFIYGDLNQTAIYKPGITAKILASQSEGKPAVVFDCAGHKPWSWYLLPREEISMLLAETLSGGANFWVALFPSDISQPELGAVSSYNELIEKNPKAFLKTKSLAKVALVWPSLSAEVYDGSSVPLTDFTKETRPTKAGDIAQEFVGIYEGLARSQVPFDVIDEYNFEDLSQYELLILPNVACLSEKHCDILRAFVKNGGNLIASFETSLYNEDGQMENDFQLAELFGVKFSGEIFGPMNWDYVSPSPRARSPFLKGITKKYIPAPDYGIKTGVTTGKVLSYFCSKLIGCYDHVPEISSIPFLVANHFGNGTVAYLAGTFGISLANFRFPEHLTLMRNLAVQLSSPVVRMNGAPWVEVSLRSNRDRIFLHLVNQTSGLKRPLTYIHPLNNLRIDLPGMRAEEAHALRLNKKLKLKRGQAGISIILPSLEDYEIVSLKLGD